MANIHTRRDARIPRTCLAVTLGIGLAAWAVAPAPTPAQALGLFGGSAAGDAATADGTVAATGTTLSAASSASDASSAARRAGSAGSDASDASARAYVAPTALSADPRSLQFQIDDALFQLPCPVSELRAIGLEFDARDAGTIVEAGYSVTTSLYFGDPHDYVYVTVTIINTGATELPIEQCTVESISAHAGNLGGHAVMAAGGLAVGAATRADVEALLGPSEKPYEDGSYAALRYDGAADAHDHLEYDFKDGVLNDCTLDSGVEYTIARDKSADAARAQVAAATTYARVTPAIPTLSSDPFAFQIAFDGTVMQAPGYVADFLALGFTMNPEDVGDVLDAHYSTSVTLNWGDPSDYHYINVSIYNPGENPLTFEQCMVDDVYVTDVMADVMTVTTPGGITLGTSTIADVQAVYGTQTSYEYHSDDGSFVTLEYEPAGDFANKMSFSFVNGVLDGVTVGTRGM